MAAIEVQGLTKRYGAVTAVDDLTFAIEPGTVTGFLGPNGAGKTTTLRMLLGLARPTAGSATFAGERFAELDDPAGHVGVVLEPRFHPGRRAVDHLRGIAAATGATASRIDAVLDMVGLADAASRRAGGFSLGMRQRLALAAALLGDPQVLVLDEPANGLDPEGVHWLRTLLQHLGDEGRTVLVSSHLLAEVAQTVDDVLVIARGRFVAHTPLDELMARSGSVVVRTPDAATLTKALRRHRIATTASEDGVVVTGTGIDTVGKVIADVGVVVYELRTEVPTLEDLFLELTTEERS